MCVNPKFRITSSHTCGCCALLVLYADTRRAAIDSLKNAVYAMIKANARLDTRQGHKVMNQCADAETRGRVTVRLLGDCVTFEKLPEGFTP